MASSGVLPTQNGTLESFDSSEFSLIPDPDQPSFAEAMSQSTANASPFRSATFDLHGEEIQRRLVELAEDNRSLRESLQNSSAVMKSDYDVIATWHDNITSTIAQQKVSLQEAQERISQLEREKEELLQAKEGVSLKGENGVLSDEDSEYEIVQKKSKDAEKMKQELKDADLKILNLKQEMEAQTLKIEKLKEMYEDNEKEKSCLKSQLGNQDTLNAKVCNLLKQLAEYEETNNALQAKVQDLEGKLQSQEEAHLLSQASQEEMDKVKSLEDKIKLEVLATEAERSRYLETKKLLSVLQSNYDRVTKILQMQSRNQERRTSEDSEARRNLEQIDNLTAQLFDLQQRIEERDEEILQLKKRHGETPDLNAQRLDGGQEARRNLEHIDNLTAKLFDLEQKLEEREEEMVQLNRKLDLQKELAETVPILNAQLEMLKVDLDNAVLSKEAAQEEILQLKDLQTQNTATFCSNCGAGSEHSGSPSRHGRRRTHGHRSSSRSDAENHQRLDSELFVCPVCQFGFTELQALENHVNSCLDKIQK